jgi:hypothetical protein
MLKEAFANTSNMAAEAPKRNKAVLEELERMSRNVEKQLMLTDSLCKDTRPVASPFDIDESPNKPIYGVPLADGLSCLNWKIEAINTKLEAILNSLEV